MFAIKLSMEKWIKKIWAAGFSDLPAINATVVSKVQAFSEHMNFMSTQMWGPIYTAKNVPKPK